jgi:hypothetical protein
MSNAEYLLKSFAAFAAEHGQTHVQVQTAIDWAALGPTEAQRDARLKAVCRFVRHIQIEDARHELPPANHFGARKKRRPPHIYSTDEIDRLVEAALRLRPKGGLRPLTFATLIALLSSRLTCPRLASRQAGPWSRKISATSRAGPPTPVARYAAGLGLGLFLGRWCAPPSFASGLSMTAIRPVATRV